MNSVKMYEMFIKGIHCSYKKVNLLHFGVLTILFYRLIDVG